jgi:hypothetical protein
MASYILRDIDPDLWKRVKAKAALQTTTLKALVERLLRLWLSDDTARQMRLACEWGYRQCEKGHNLDYVLLQFNELTERPQSTNAVDPSAECLYRARYPRRMHPRC